MWQTQGVVSTECGVSSVTLVSCCGAGVARLAGHGQSVHRVAGGPQSTRLPRGEGTVFMSPHLLHKTPTHGSKVIQCTQVYPK